MKTLLFAFTFFLFHWVSLAQSNLKAQLGFYGKIGLPVGEFRETVNNSFGGTGWGFGISLLINPKKGIYSPVLVGIEGNYLNFGIEKTQETTFLPQLKTTFNYFNAGPIFRVFLRDREEGFTPFLDAFLGINALYTKTKIDNPAIDTLIDEEIPGSLLTTFNEGLGFGIGLGFFNRKFRDENGAGEGSFFMRIMYQYGDRINYVKKGSIQVDDEGYITYQTGRTETSMLSIQFGVLF